MKKDLKLVLTRRWGGNVREKPGRSGEAAGKDRITCNEGGIKETVPRDDKGNSKP